MQQATHDIAAIGNALLTALRFGIGICCYNALVWACFMAEGHVFDQDAMQMALIENDQLVQALFADGAHPVG
jgi:hypothetical protein